MTHSILIVGVPAGTWIFILIAVFVIWVICRHNDWLNIDKYTKASFAFSKFLGIFDYLQKHSIKASDKRNWGEKLCDYLNGEKIDSITLLQTHIAKFFTSQGKGKEYKAKVLSIKEFQLIVDKFYIIKFMENKWTITDRYSLD